jgi:hypothetical protein
MKHLLILSAILLAACSPIEETPVIPSPSEPDSPVVENPSVLHEWIIIKSGDRATVYEGNVELRGYIVQKPIYVGDLFPQFQVIEEDYDKIPELSHKFGHFRIFDQEGNESPEELIKKIEQHSKENPYTITATKITLPMEGSPRIEIE